MNIVNLKNRIASYLQRNPSDFVVNGYDLLLDAINKVHQDAMQLYDFEFAKVSVDALVDLQNGVPVSPLPIHNTTNQVTVKKVLRSYIGDGYGGARPIKFISRDWQAADADQRWYGIPYPFAPAQRDMPSYPTFYEVYLVQQGPILQVYPNARVVVPQNPLPVFLDVVRYFPDYTDPDDNVDFFLQFGDNWLGFAAICYLNTFVKEFVPRQEGNIPSPTQERDEAWSKLIAWDAQLLTTGDSEAATLD